MRFDKKYLCLILLCLTAIVLCGCGPKSDPVKLPSVEDNFAPNEGAEVELPFSTDRVEATFTPRVSTVQGWLGETVTLTRGVYQVLNQGNMGADVKNLQKRLIELGYMSGTATGTFNEATTLAVKRFEEAYGQPQTGIATELMQMYLFSDTVRRYTGVVTVTATAYYSAGSRTLQIGDSGSDVVQLKNRLSQLGYLQNAYGNYFDGETAEAVKAFQAAYGMSRTGIASAELQKYLYSGGAITAYEAQHTPVPTATPAPTNRYRTLKSGDSGQEVMDLQNRLRELGYMTSKADGKYGEKTVEAVKRFEAAYGKEETGKATAAMQSFLFSDDALRYGMETPTPEPSATPDDYVMLAYGSEGAEVARLQARLIDLGYLTGEADGNYGSKTKEAVAAFENANGYTATGVATMALQKYLFSEAALPCPAGNDRTYTELSMGAYGGEVGALQQRLADLGYYNGSITGYYDDATALAVMAFEAAYDRSPSGVATEVLQLALYSDSAKANTVDWEDNKPVRTYHELKKGNRGESVTKLQQRLIELGYLGGTADGYYGDGTADAVMAFEAAYGKTRTGIATVEMQTYLFSDSAKVNTGSSMGVSYITLERNDKGNEVYKLQERLIQLGYLNGEANGVYDSRTVSAVKAYQKVMGITQNGIASSTMQRTLFSDSAKYNTDDRVVEVNRGAYVSASVASTYGSYLDSAASGSISKGTHVQVLRTRGIWAQINLNGNLLYVLLDDLTYESGEPAHITDSAVTVNKPALISANNVVVYKSPSESGEVWGVFKAGTQVTWLRTNGDWAEIKSGSGKIGYVYTAQLSLESEGGNTSSTFTTLKSGSTGNAVKQLQTRLKALGYFSGDIGGNFLTKTESAVKLFQKQIGLNADGIATPGLQEVLYSSYAPKYKAYAEPKQKKYTDMYRGRRDDDVSDLQLYLMSFGYLDSSDCTLGSYDDATLEAVKKLQSAMGLPDANGLASRELQAFLHTKAAEGLRR